MRSSHPARRDDAGFTLIELLVVMIIIGILAAIAIPAFLSERRKAQDTAAKADASTVGKELATYFVEGTGAPTVSIPGGPYVMNVDAVAGPPAEPAIVDRDLGKASANNAVGAQLYTNDTAWCLTISNVKGDQAVTGYKYSAAGGVAAGACAAATG
jgi:type IV pilus assembly protein PilA